MSREARLNGNIRKTITIIFIVSFAVYYVEFLQRERDGEKKRPKKEEQNVTAKKNRRP